MVELISKRNCNTECHTSDQNHSNDKKKRYKKDLPLALKTWWGIPHMFHLPDSLVSLWRASHSTMGHCAINITEGLRVRKFSYSLCHNTESYLDILFKYIRDNCFKYLYIYKCFTSREIIKAWQQLIIQTCHKLEATDSVVILRSSTQLFFALLTCKFESLVPLKTDIHISA